MEFDKEFWTTLFFTIINILVLYFILKKLLFKPVTNFMDNRTNKIDEALKMAEEAKVAIRSIRREGIDIAKAEQKEGIITEDELKQAENEIQKMTDKKIDEIDKILEGKEKEIMSV